METHTWIHITDSRCVWPFPSTQIMDFFLCKIIAHNIIVLVSARHFADFVWRQHFPQTTGQWNQLKTYWLIIDRTTRTHAPIPYACRTHYGWVLHQPGCAVGFRFPRASPGHWFREEGAIQTGWMGGLGFSFTSIEIHAYAFSDTLSMVIRCKST